jgi:hypothetical protein
MIKKLLAIVVLMVALPVASYVVLKRLSLCS